MRLMAIDYGEKRVGIASTDESGEFALPRSVLENDETLIDKVSVLAKEHQSEKIIMGESRDFKGVPNSIFAPAREFAEKLRHRGFVVEFHPELLTSLEAKQLQGKNRMLDASAAALILKSYIDSNKKQGDIIQK